LLRLPEVVALVRLGRSAIYAAVARGEFPPPLKIGKRASAWRRADVEAWVEERVAQREGAK